VELKCRWQEDANILMRIFADNGYAPKLEKKKELYANTDGEMWTRDSYYVTSGNKKSE